MNVVQWFFLRLLVGGDGIETLGDFNRLLLEWRRLTERGPQGRLPNLEWGVKDLRETVASIDCRMDVYGLHMQALAAGGVAFSLYPRETHSNRYFKMQGDAHYKKEPVVHIRKIGEPMVVVLVNNLGRALASVDMAPHVRIGDVVVVWCSWKPDPSPAPESLRPAYFEQGFAIGVRRLGVGDIFPHLKVVWG